MSIEAQRYHRILTTHVGSLPRPDALSEMMAGGAALSRRATPKPCARPFRTWSGARWNAASTSWMMASSPSPDSSPISMSGLAAWKPRTDNPPQLDTREKRAFPEFYAHGHSGSRPPPMLCTGPVRYIGQAQLQTDIQNLKDALQGASVEDVFMPAVSPGQILRYHVNRYYPSDDEFLVAVGEAMREEYQAIIDAGFMLQIDDPHLAMHYMLEPSLSVEECRRWASHYVEILNHTLRDLPVDRIRHHTCYGINMGPRMHDLEFRHLIDIVLKIRAELLFVRGGQSAPRARMEAVGRRQAAAGQSHHSRA